MEKYIFKYIIGKYKNPFVYYILNYHISSSHIYAYTYIYSIYATLCNGQCRPTLSSLDLLNVNGDRGSSTWSLHPIVEHKFCWLSTWPSRSGFAYKKFDIGASSNRVTIEQYGEVASKR